MAAQLSPLQRRALRAVVARPARTAHVYPGGARTIKALKARGLVEVSPLHEFGVHTEVICPTLQARAVLGELDRTP